MPGDLSVKITKPVLTQEISKISDPIRRFLGCKGSQIKSLTSTYPFIFIYVYGYTIGKLLKENYEICEQKHDEFAHFFLSKRFMLDENEMAGFPWEGLFYLRLPSSEKLVLRADFTGWRSPLPFIELYVEEKRIKLAQSFFSQLEEQVSGIQHQVFSGSGRFMSVDENIGWTDIVLKPRIKETIIYNTSGLFSKKDLFKEKGIPLKRGLLFYGPPGNGKTMVGKILAREVEANFIWVTPKDLTDAPSRNMANIYSFARLLAPTIVFFEDIDLIGGEDRFGKSFPSILGELLNQLDGFDSNHGVITIATTNNIEILDKALANRPGRFDIRIEFPNPDYQLRLAILKRYMQNHPVAPGLNLECLARKSEGLSCAHIKEIITRALILGLEKECFDEVGEILLTQENLEQALAAVGGQRRQVGFCSGNLEKDEVANSMEGF
jgi:hypothetical protein